MTPEARLEAARAEVRQALREAGAALKGERGRRRGALNRTIHEARGMLEPGYPYRSQAGQDAVVDAIFGRKQGGTFLDIGGYDGVTGSNTLFLERHRGWRGALVEPVPAQLEKAKAARRCPCLRYAVAAEAGEAEFIEIAEGYTQMSGLSGSYDEGLLRKVRADPRHREAVIRVETRTLSGLLEETGLEHPDFISLDIEGGEVAALAAFPFARHRVGLWAIENNSGTGEIGRIMRAAGYALAEFCGPDEIWRLPDL
ncbi:FkbM family methyltransferase [Pseudoroseicyclus tamaricis]|uniref:FkbM family methyltransferase n=1 Tax=Pseudoroseicyclus tamaricis TaxID=2705421 RepID=A0A6B2K0P6_9RHOB|nr:FkbM family methyltransferase [Pseudoroseicyclus tamaricis]NDV02519.1 FkbM family methyltransferase [Pseudoroseicyclus tamaricis]